MYFVYILECADGTLYTGSTTDVARRFDQHVAKKGARYTRSRRAVRVVYTETCRDKSSALKREMAIKKLKRKEKLNLIQM